jgi:hypothetical protein
MGGLLDKLRGKVGAVLLLAACGPSSGLDLRWDLARPDDDVSRRDRGRRPALDFDVLGFDALDFDVRSEHHYGV